MSVKCREEPFNPKKKTNNSIKYIFDMDRKEDILKAKQNNKIVPNICLIFKVVRSDDIYFKIIKPTKIEKGNYIANINNIGSQLINFISKYNDPTSIDNILILDFILYFIPIDYSYLDKLSTDEYKFTFRPLEDFLQCKTDIYKLSNPDENIFNVLKCRNCVIKQFLHYLTNYFNFIIFYPINIFRVKIIFINSISINYVNRYEKYSDNPEDKIDLFYLKKSAKKRILTNNIKKAKIKIKQIKEQQRKTDKIIKTEIEKLNNMIKTINSLDN